MFLLPDVTITGNCNIYYRFLNPLVDHHNIELVSHLHLVDLDPEVPQDLTQSFSITIEGDVHFHPGTPCSGQMFLYTMSGTWL